MFFRSYDFCFLSLLDQLQEAVVVAQSNPYDKHVDILLKSSSLIRQMAGVVCILCKSGKQCRIDDCAFADDSIR